MPTERYTSYVRMTIKDMPEFDPARCDAVIGGVDSYSGFRWSAQCSRKPVKNGLCKQHAKMDEVPFMQWSA